MNFSNMDYECISRQVRIISISCGVQEVERLLINRQQNECTAVQYDCIILLIQFSMYNKITEKILE